MYTAANRKAFQSSKFLYSQPLPLSPDYTVVRFSLDRFLLIQELYRTAFGLRLSQKEFLKKYDTRSLGHEAIGFLAIHEPTGTPAAYYGVFPLRIRHGDKTVLAAQSGDTMTHPQHRKKGLFTELARLTFDACRQSGIGLVFGLPNEQSYPGFIQKLHWQHRDDIQRLDAKLPAKTFPLPKLCRRLGVFGLYRSYARFLLRKQILPQPHSFSTPQQAGYASVLRDYDYLLYKQGPDHFFLRIGAVTVWIKLTDVLLIGDLDNYEAAGTSFLPALQRIAFRLGYNTISFHRNQSLRPTVFLEGFRVSRTWPSCLFALDPQWRDLNLLLTTADFDTW